MKYKRQIATGIFAFALMTGSPLTFGAAPEETVPKMIQMKQQLSMRSKDVSDDTEIDRIGPKGHDKKIRRSRPQAK
jgi:hypothetical protein